MHRVAAVLMFTLAVTLDASTTGDPVGITRYDRRIPADADLPLRGGHALPSQSRADSVQDVRQFVQAFYHWYTPIAIADHRFPAWYSILKNDDQYLDRTLAAALRADSAVAQMGPMKATRQTIDFDPFLDSQDPCKPYEVAGVSRRGNVFRVVMRACHAKEIGPIVEIRAIRGRWLITNVLYGDGDLKSYLCRWAKGDLRRDRRPTKC